MPTNETRTLVGAAVNIATETKQSITLFQDKVALLTTALNSLIMTHCDMLLGYKVYWWSDIKHMDTDLYLSQKNNMLIRFHRSLLPRIKLNRKFPLALIPIAPVLEIWN